MKKNNYNSSLKSKGNSNVVKKEKVFNVPFETYYYRDLVWKVNFTNELIIETPV